ncbi:alpha-tubulin N-acetyltransferase-like isoform X2 [Macrosteles quadrilineatus]|uniref:alpha-tubulin N-acetyltransferase-like isoform X2 n=1 Tax=Macrosteles quadrilineatus TaxID=74068 RepID=UPI0023E1CFC6|nr:alpha-tubulin N-acetyltransferase-like isoform X2 [Macrosteles quadrilineatus]XP_054274902.1 alpha-tubulin N-acetyltransferase-like isoform X2 [Macrosteles quadrilineatus]
MEFNYNLNEIFQNYISKVCNTLLPADFNGDRKRASHVASQVADIVDSMGLASAKAQGLHHPITSAEKSRNCDHTLYIMIDPRENHGNGSVVGILKMGVKHLFLFDATGMVHEKETLCVLDFYVHESKQRTGLGKIMFDYMLEDKDTVPCKLAIDKPSQTFLSFLNKHYGLAKIYPQNNNFVLFEGFFDEKRDVSSSLESLENSYVSEKSRHEKEVRDNNQSVTDRREREDYLPHLYGRHTAFKPHDTMGDRITWLTPSDMNQHSALW